MKNVYWFLFDSDFNFYEKVIFMSAVLFGFCIAFVFRMIKKIRGVFVRFL